jgi:hypothetical protein
MKKCKNCKKKFIEKQTKQIYCSRSCAATINNTKNIKRTKTKKCKDCDTLILSKNTYCPKCIKKGLHLRGKVFLSEKTIGDVSLWQGANRYAVVRCHARKITKNRIKKCCVCNYDKHVEICHIKGIGDYPPETKISTINHPDNLVLLCPNCHWEFDHHYLNLVGLNGLEPLASKL